MGKDRQEKKLKHSRRVESDRDQSLEYGGSAKLQSSEEARRQQKP
ncbi:YpzI family protein [Halalkalibacter nanhaiisediminis]|nr:YpzI family protein [Halalkalibacter nanhaiisediminis]